VVKDLPEELSTSGRRFVVKDLPEELSTNEPIAESLALEGEIK
jgi:hypothetical protein